MYSHNMTHLSCTIGKLTIWLSFSEALDQPGHTFSLIRVDDVRKRCILGFVMVQLILKKAILKSSRPV